MKFVSAVLHLSIASVVLANSDDAHRELYGYNDACIQSHTITLDGGTCNYEAIAELIKEAIDAEPGCKEGTNVANELRALFMNEDLTLDQVADTVNEACEAAFYELMYGGKDISYIDILDDSQQMVKEYFDGRGAVNSDHEYDRAIGLGEKILTTHPIQWPGDSCFDYKEEIPQKVHSQFPHGHFKKSHQHRVTTNPKTGIKTLHSNGHGRREKYNYAPVQNFDQCELNTAMCCWTESTDTSRVYGQQATRKTVEHNTDICYVNMADAPSSSRVRAGFAIFPGLSEVQEGQGSVRCHGFNWAEDPMDVTNLFRGNALFEASFQKHLERGGYVSSISGAPMCGCLEQMPVVTRADCTQINVADFEVHVEIKKGCIEVKIPESNKITFSPCTADPEPAAAEAEADPSDDYDDTNRRLQALVDPAATTNATDPANSTNTTTTSDVVPKPSDVASTNSTSNTTTTNVVGAEEPSSNDDVPTDKKVVPENVIDLRAHYELMVKKNLIPDNTKEVARRLVGEGGCTEIVASFFDENGIHGYR